MSFWRNISPKGAIGDFIDVWSEPTPYRWQIMGVALALTFAFFALLIPESERIPPERPSITYISTYADGRTDEEIIASNLANQQRKDELEAQREEAAERRKELYRALGRATGVDVDEMERQIAADKAAEEAAAAKTQAAAEASSPQEPAVAEQN